MFQCTTSRVNGAGYDVRDWVSNEVSHTEIRLYLWPRGIPHEPGEGLERNRPGHHRLNELLIHRWLAAIRERGRPFWRASRSAALVASGLPFWFFHAFTEL